MQRMRSLLTRSGLARTAPPEQPLRDTAAAFVEVFDLPGAENGPLAGLGFAAKDIFDVAGHVTGCGNPAWAASHPPAETHAACVATCLAAGGLLRGKTHTDELAYSLMGANAHSGTPLNSAAPDRVPGGSSSGSAAATAAGLVDFALGSDTGGSVRVPGSFCGLHGLRTTHGRVPTAGMAPLAPSFDVVGWFARTARMLAAVGEAFDLGSDGALPRPRLLLPSDAWDRAEPSTQAAVRPIARKLQDLFGAAQTVQLSAAPLSEWRELFRVCQAGEAWEVHGAWIRAEAPDFGPGVADRFAAASRITAAERQAAEAARAEVRSGLRDLLGDDGVLVLPTAPGPAPLKTADEATLDAYRGRALEMLAPAGLAGLPQLTLPAGLVGGAPVGLSLLGPAGADRALAEMAVRLDDYLMAPHSMA
jgi:amidase